MLHMVKIWSASGSASPVCRSNISAMFEEFSEKSWKTVTDKLNGTRSWNLADVDAFSKNTFCSVPDSGRLITTRIRIILLDVS